MAQLAYFYVLSLLTLLKCIARRNTNGELRSSRALRKQQKKGLMDGS